MTDYAANVHFLTERSSEARKDGFLGGYGWFLGRFPAWRDFERELRAHLKTIGYNLVEVETVIEIESADDLGDGEQQELYLNLSESNPIQYRTLHLYQRDDA